MHLDELESLWGQGLVRLFPSEGETSPDPTDGFDIDSTNKGLAVLINGTPNHLGGVVANYEVPDGTVAALVPLLDVRRVLAADRYVSTAYNIVLSAFSAASRGAIMPH